MITLEAAQTFRGIAGTAAVVTFSMFGDELDTAGGTDSFKLLAQGQLANTTSTLDTVPAGKAHLVKQIVLANTTGSIVSGISFFVGGTAATNRVTGTVAVPANGTAIWDDSGWHIYDANGQSQVTASLSLTGDVTGSGAGSIATTLASIITAGGPTGSSSVVPVITYDAKGRLTAVTTATVTPAAIGAVASVAATDTTLVAAGTATNPTLARAAITGDVAIPSASNTATLANVISAAGPIGSTSVVPVITYDAKGRLTTVTTATITPAAIGAVAGVTAGDASITIAGTATNPTVATGRLDQIATLHPPTAAVGLNSQKITGLADGTVATDAVTLQQLQAAIDGRKAKDPVLWTTTGNITLSGLGTQANGEWTGALTAGDRILAKDQTSSAANGIYLAAAGAWTRSTDTDTAAEITKASTLVLFGAIAIGDTFTQTATVTTIGTDPQTWVQTGEGATITADGSTLELVGNQIREKDAGTTNAKLANMGALTVKGSVAGGVPADLTPAQITTNFVVPDNSTLEVAASQLRIKNQGVTHAKYQAIANLTILANVAGGSFSPQEVTFNQATALLSTATATAQGVMSASDYRRIRAKYNAVEDFGFVGDNRAILWDGVNAGYGGNCSTGAPTKITSNNAAFVAGDLNKRITLSGAGASGAKYVGVITNVDSATQVTVSPSISTTVSQKGLNVETNNTTAIGNMATAINAQVYPGAVVEFPASATNRYGFPILVPTLNKPATLSGQGRFYNDDYGDYAKGGGTALVWTAPTSDGGTAFSGMLRFEPVTGATAQHMHGVGFRDIWIDGRNGDQAFALFGIQMYSQEGFEIQRFGAIDCISGAVEFGITSPIGGVAAAARGTMEDFGIRCLENDGVNPATLTPTTTTTAATLSTTPQSYTLAAANGLTASGYVWMETENGYPVLVNYTGGGGTTTLTGCTVSAKDAAEIPKTLSGCNVVQAVPGNGPALKFCGDSAGNTNLNFFRMGQVSHGTTYGPAAMDCRNSDSNVFHQVVINGGNNLNMATGPTVKRVTKPGYRFNGSDASLAQAARNNVIYDGDAGAGGVSAMAFKGGGTKMLAPSGPNFVYGLQLGNGQPAPTIEAGAYLDWPNPNGGAPQVGLRSISTSAAVAYVAGTPKTIDGTVMLLAPQAIQLGTTFHWEIQFAKTGAGTTAHTLTIRLGATGTTTDATISTFTLTTTAATDQCIMEIDYVITTLSGGVANGVAVIRQKSKSAAVTAGFWSATLGSVLVGTPGANFSAPVSGLQYISLVMNIGTGTTGMSSSLGIGKVERVGNQAA